MVAIVMNSRCRYCQCLIFRRLRGVCESCAQERARPVTHGASSSRGGSGGASNDAGDGDDPWYSLRVRRLEERDW